jgi:hypothetical protein
VATVAVLKLPYVNCLKHCGTKPAGAKGMNLCRKSVLMKNVFGTNGTAAFPAPTYS